MKVEYVSANKRLKVSFEGNEKELFKQLAHFQEVFEKNNVCGKCNSDEVTFSTRNVEGNDYYEKVCGKCGHKFQYGQNKKGDTLFPKYSKGWTFYKNDQKDEEDDTDVFDEKPKRISGKGK